MSLLLKMITPDWQATWTAKEAEEQMNGFQVKGPGWYFKDGTSMLVVSTEIPDVYTFLVFFDRDPREAFSVIGDGPVRMGTGQKESEGTGMSGLFVLMLGMLVLIPLASLLIAKLHWLGFIISAIVALFFGRWARSVGKPKANEAEK